jgi:hypothetical protein
LRYVFTASNPSIHCVRHAVSIDEYRSFFAQNLFKHRAGQDIKEVWFAGVHCDIGGGYCEEESGLAKIALQWMMVQARDVEGGDILFNPSRVMRLFKGDHGPNHAAVIHQSMTWKWWPAELFPKQRFGSPLPLPHLFRKRYLVARTAGNRSMPKCRLHQSVIRRLEEKGLDYAPRNLPREFDIEPEVAF